MQKQNKKLNSLTVIIPCYNEEENLFQCVERIPVMPWKTEIIGVNDGSTDNTLKEMKRVERKNFRFYSYPQRKGKGFAVRHSLKNARNDVVIIQDCDMSTIPKEIPLVVKPIFEEKADFVNTSRLELMEPKAMNQIHLFGNKVFALLTSILTGFNFSDTLSGFKAFKRKDFLNELKENSWMDFELIFLAKKKKLRVLEIPVHYKKRVAGKSKMRTFYHGIEMILLMAKAFLESL